MKREKGRNYNIQNENEDITNNPTLKTLRMARGYYEQFYAKTFENLHDKFQQNTGNANTTTQSKHTHKIGNRLKKNNPSFEIFTEKHSLSIWLPQRTSHNN